jgi:hypothetical protein
MQSLTKSVPKPSPCANDDDELSYSGWDSWEENGNCDDKCHPLYKLLTTYDSDEEFAEYEGREPYWTHIHSNPSATLIVALGNTYDVDIKVVSSVQEVASYWCPCPKRKFRSPLLRWDNTIHFATEESMIDAVLQRTRPIATATFDTQSKYETVLDKVKASGFPFQTQPELRLIKVAQPMTLGEAFDLKMWLKCFKVVWWDDLENRVRAREQLLSAEDKEHILSLKDTPLSYWLERPDVPTHTTCGRALLNLLSGLPTECTLSDLWDIQIATWKQQRVWIL